MLDFGSGDCDAEAELTLHNGEVRIVIYINDNAEDRKKGFG